MLTRDYLCHARCDECALQAYHLSRGTFSPLADYVSDDPDRFLVIGPYPSPADVAAGAPYRGDSSVTTVTILREEGRDPTTYSRTNVIACAYPSNNAKDIARFEADVAKSEYLDPKVACRPRVEALVADHPHIILQGTEAVKAVMGDIGIDGVIGGPFPAPEQKVKPLLEGKKLLVTKSPGIAATEPRWAPVQRVWLKRALSWFKGTLKWKDPPYLVNPPIPWLQERLRQWRSGERPHPSPPGHYAVGRPEVDQCSKVDNFEGVIGTRYVESRPIETMVIFDDETDSRDPNTANLRLRCFYDGSHYLADGSPATFVFKWRSVSDNYFGEEISYLRAMHGSYLLEAEITPEKELPALRRKYLTDARVVVDMLLDKPGLWEHTKDKLLEARAKTALKGVIQGVVKAGQGYKLPVTAMTPEYEAFVQEWMREFLTAPEIVKATWNGGGYDVAVSTAVFGVETTPHVDWMVWHRLAWPDWRHGLKITAAILLDIWSWASEIDAIDTSSDEDLALYNVRDGGATDGVARYLQPRAARSGHNIWHHAMFSELQEIFRGVRAIGRDVDVARLNRLIDEQEVRKAKARELLADINPNSSRDVAALVYGKLKLPVPKRTDRGAPSVDDESIRALYSSPLLPAEYRPQLAAIRDWKSADKALGTFLRKFIPGTWDDNGRCWYVTPEGIAHPSYNATGTAAWRASSQGGWNDQNIPNDYRCLFRARAGYVYVYIDMDAVELKGAAALSGAEGYLSLMESGTKDLHVYAMELIYGEGIYNMPGAPPRGTPKKGDAGSKFADLREITKTGVYLGLYWGEAKAFLRVLQAIERRNPTTGELEFPYARYPLEKAQLILDRWRQAAPEFERWWNKCISEFRRDGYVEEPISGLRRFLPDGEERSIIINHKVQGMCRAIFNNAIIRLTRGPVPFKLGERTGIVADTHDSIVVCCRWEDAEQVAADIEGLMVQRYPQWPVTFTGKAKIRRNWNNPPCSVCGREMNWVNARYLHVCSDPNCGNVEE